MTTGCQSIDSPICVSLKTWIQISARHTPAPGLSSTQGTQKQVRQSWQKQLTWQADLCFFPLLPVLIFVCACKKNSFDAFAGLCPPLIQIYMCFLSNFIGKNFGLCYLFLLVASLKSCPGKVSSPANSIQFSEVQWSSLAFIEIHLFKHNVYIKLS